MLWTKEAHGKWMLPIPELTNRKVRVGMSSPSTHTHLALLTVPGPIEEIDKYVTGKAWRLRRYIV